MPLTVYGDNTATLVLPTDKGEKPRTLRLKFLSKKDIRSWQKRVADARKIEDVDARDAAYDVLMGEVVTGWENIPGDFSVAGISEHYTLPEVMHILDAIPMAMVPDIEDKKK